ncbi:alpha/beta hydrolase [Moraxella canis]|uniref:Alpha/beta hydrolase n=2 Tax=Moraxella canis TaxID=90239 RepID=A0A1S9ZL63_9GAMM|nr:alpha/beta hydrolase [Moraxella canis]
MEKIMQKITFTAKDGYALGGTFFNGSGGLTQPYPVLIAPATGIKQGFYYAFAEHLSAQGYNVLCFDFRGIGASLHGALKDSQASIDDWGVYDLPAAIDQLTDMTGAEQVAIIGHSAGAQLLGVAHNYHKVARLISVAGSTGYVPKLSGRTKLLAPLMFEVLFRVSSRTLGYGATKIIGMGENLPKHVARQWREFCNTGQYIKYSIGKTIFDDYHDKISCPIHAFYATDDEIATRENVHDFFALYPHAQVHYHELHPADYGFDEIGHMNLFRRSYQRLWLLLVDALSED